MSVELLPQSPKLKLMVMNLPGDESPWGGLSIRDAKTSFQTALSAEEFVSWTARGGATPATMMEQVVQALGEGAWGRERALGQLRILVAACAEVVTQPAQARPSPGARQVAEAQLFLQSQYYQPTLTIKTVAEAQGISASHLSTLFSKITGKTLHKTLVDIRLRRARALLTSSSYSIKEIAALTGWSNQLYFSAAHRQRYGHPPSAVRGRA
jgi:transcriptional regulator GlxA family with amidase domain